MLDAAHYMTTNNLSLSKILLEGITKMSNLDFYIRLSSTRPLNNGVKSVEIFLLQVESILNNADDYIFVTNNLQVE